MSYGIFCGTKGFSIVIQVCAYNPHWKEQFESLKRQIWPAVSAYANRIEHVGSTAVEGMWAKPIIDLDIVVNSNEALTGVISGLASIGYVHRGNLGIEGREAFMADNPVLKHNLYACMEDCLAFRNHILLRDHLRKHPKDLNKYSEIKRELARKFSDDIDSYVDGKTEFILSILKAYHVDENELSAIEKANRKP